VVGNLYGQVSAGSVWAFHVQARLTASGWLQSEYDRSVYIRKYINAAGDPAWERTGVFVDDLLISSGRMAATTQELERELGSFKHVSDPSVEEVRYVGADLKLHFPTTTLDIYCRTYIADVIQHVENLGETEGSGFSLRKFKIPQMEEGDKSPMAEDDRPELLDGDDNDFLSTSEKTAYQSLIGAANWCVTLCRVDIAFSVNALAAFNAAPRVGHLRRVLRIFGYLKANPSRALRMDPTPFDIGQTNRDALNDHLARDLRMEYGDHDAEPSERFPEPLGKPLALTGFCDADHGGHLLTRRSTSGFLLFLASSLIAWKVKRQVGAEGASMGSELRACGLTVKEIRGLRGAARAMGIPLVPGPTPLLVDNAAVVYAATTISTALRIKHLAIDFHSCREMCAWGIVRVMKTPSAENLADVLTKAVKKDIFHTLTDVLMVSPAKHNKL